MTLETLLGTRDHEPAVAMSLPLTVETFGLKESRRLIAVVLATNFLGPGRTEEELISTASRIARFLENSLLRPS